MERRRLTRIVGGLFLVAVGVFYMTSLATYNAAQGPFADAVADMGMPNACGTAGAVLSSYSFALFGLAAFLIPLVVLGFGLALAFGSLRPVGTYVRLAGVLLFGSGLMVGLAHLVHPTYGGMMGTLMSQSLTRMVGVVGVRLLVAFAAALGAYLAAGRHIVSAVRLLAGLGARVGRGVANAVPESQARPRKSAAEPVAQEREPEPEPAAQAEVQPKPSRAELRERRRQEKAAAKAAKAAEKARLAAEKAEVMAEAESVAAAGEEVDSEAEPEEVMAAAEDAMNGDPDEAAVLDDGEDLADLEIDLEVVMHQPTKSKKKNSAPREPEPIDPDEYQLPPLDIVGYVSNGGVVESEDDIREKGRLLQKTLSEFKVGAQVVRVSRGPVITMYELSLAPGTKVSKVESLANDLAIALKAPNVRIVAPLPGRNTIGIEVPNADREVIGVREMLEENEDKHSKMAIPLFLGKDTAGHPLILDLASCPHLLVAGATGSGKSVSINTMIGSILLTRKPTEVQMLLIDPKCVEFTDYAKLPHLICPVVTDMKKAAAVLKWACKKMDERYSLLSAVGVRNLKSYNALGEEGIRKRLDAEEEAILDDIPTYMSHIVIIIDEFGELMMIAAKEVEAAVIRLSQKARAVGIHLICATQRPSVDVITGLIKSNLPARIAFQVASKVDSRTILDRNGAELLLGKGDLLLLPPGTSRLVRAQGSYIPDEDLRNLVHYLETQGEPQFRSDLREHTQAALDDGEQEDELYDEAVRIILDSQRGSVSLLQRRLAIGYSRAARLIDMMAEAGLVGPYRGSQARQVLMTLEEWDAAHASA